MIIANSDRIYICNIHNLFKYEVEFNQWNLLNELNIEYIKEDILSNIQFSEKYLIFYWKNKKLENWYSNCIF